MQDRITYWSRRFLKNCIYLKKIAVEIKRQKENKMDAFNANNILSVDYKLPSDSSLEMEKGDGV